MFTTKDELVCKLFAVMPCHAQISALDTSGEDDAIRFAWRGSRYRVNLGGFVEEVRGCMLVGSDAAVLIRALLGRREP